MKPSPRQQTIRLCLRDGAIVMEALAEYPFKLVFELIGKLNLQANQQPGSVADESQECEFSLTNDEMSLIVKALGAMPYSRVHGLLANLQTQIVRPRRKNSPKT